MATIPQIIKEKKTLIADLERQLELQRAVLDELLRLGENGEVEQKALKNKAKSAKPGTLASHVEEVLSNNGGEMSSADIVSELEDRGVETSAAAGLSPSVAVVLSRGTKNGDFVRVRSGVYRLAKIGH